MKRFTFFALAILLSFSIANAADSYMSVTTAKAVGENIKIALKAENVNTIIQIDYGDGVLVEKTIGTTGTDVSGILKGSNVKVYGDGIIWFYCDSNDLTDVDVSNYPSLLGLNCNNNDLVSLDLSQNVALHLLYCADNDLSDIDLSNNQFLTTLRCYGNQLTSLDITKNGNLLYLRCYDNLMSFASLPVPKSFWKAFEYARQAEIEISETIGDGIIDLSSQNLVNGNVTVYTWKTESGSLLVEDVDYQIDEGITTFLSSPGEKVYCEMTNATFPDFVGSNVLKTTLALVEGTGSVITPEGPPAISMTTAKGIGEIIVVELKSLMDNSVIQIDYGNGVLVQKSIGTTKSDVSGFLSGSEVKIYGEGITFFFCNRQELTSLDFSNCSTLKYFECWGNSLSDLDVSQNVELTFFGCAGNDLTSLDCSNNVKLNELACQSNDLESLNVSSCVALTKLWCQYNQILELDVTNNIELVLLECNDNQLTKLDLSNNVNLASLECFQNELITLDLSHNPVLTNVNCEHNQLTELVCSSSITRLECKNNQLPELDISDVEGLLELSCSYNELTFLDVSNNTQLRRLLCWDNKLTTLDVTNNLDLVSLLCSNNQLTELDVSNNTILNALYCYGNQLSTLDVSSITYLSYLYCYENQLTNINLGDVRTFYCYSNQLSEIDLTNSPSLHSLRCFNNQLVELDISNNTSIDYLECYDNQLTFSTLPVSTPVEGSYYRRYVYAPQADIVIDPTLEVGSPVNLSDQYERDGNITTYTWKTETGMILTEGTDFEMEGGVTTFITPQTETVYCELTNATFPEFEGDDVLKTTLTEIVESKSDDDIVPAAINVYGGVNSITLQTETNAQVEVYDIYGKPLVIKNVCSGQNTINGISQGMYIVKVNRIKGSSVRKVTVRD